MDIVVKQGGDVKFTVEQKHPNVVVKTSKKLDIDVLASAIKVIPQRINNIPFRFSQTVVEGANVIRCTLSEYPSYSPYDGKTWYAVTSDEDHNEVLYLYLGDKMIYPSPITEINVELTLVGEPVRELVSGGCYVTFYYEITANGEAVVPTTLKMNGVSITPRQSSGNITNHIANTGVSTFTLEATVGDIVQTDSASVEIVLPTYYGFYGLDVPLADMVSELEKFVLPKPEGFYEIENDDEENYLIVAVPVELDIHDIRSCGIRIPTEAIEDRSLLVAGNYRNYHVYHSVCNVKEMKVEFELV